MLKVLKLQKAKIENFYTSSHTLKVLTKDDFYKIGLRGGVLEDECHNIDLICKKYPKMAAYLLPLTFSNILLFKVAHAKRCDSLVNQQAIPQALKILETMKGYASFKNVHLKEFPTIQRGLYLLNLLFPGKSFTRLIDKAFSKTWRVGPTHGDFHLGNILATGDDSCYLIDFDNFTTNGLQALDAFTLWVDYHVRNTSLTWQEIITLSNNRIQEDDLSASIRSYFDNDIGLIAFLYIANRIGYENKFYKILSKSVRQEYQFISDRGTDTDTFR